MHINRNGIGTIRLSQQADYVTQPFGGNNNKKIFDEESPI